MDTVFLTTTTNKRLYINFISRFDGKSDYGVGICCKGTPTTITIADSDEGAVCAPFCEDHDLTLAECKEAYSEYKRQAAVAFEKWQNNMKARGVLIA